MMKPYSRTADAESVVLNFAKVLTYSRVLLYTLKEERKREDGGKVSTNACIKNGWLVQANDAHRIWRILVPVFE